MQYGTCPWCGKQKTYNGPDCQEGLAALARHRITDGRDWFYMPVFGLPGTWKSSGALQFSSMVQQPPLPGFDVQRQVILSKTEYQVARRVTPPGRVLMVDEAIKTGKDKMAFMTADNREMTQDFNTGRKLGHAVLDLMPFADDMDPRQLKHAHWTKRYEGKGYGTCYEVRRTGFRKVTIWEEPRFTFEEDHCAEVRPDLWAPYWRKVSGDVRGIEDQTLQVEERVKGHEASARRLLL